MERADVIVIGAGAAGITAAHTIGKDLDTIVLEARDRIGGRVHSSRAWPDETVDLGASWLTHALINPLTDIVKKYKIKLRDSTLLNFSLRTADGDRLSEDDIAKLFVLYFDIYAVFLAARTVFLPARTAFLPARTAFLPARTVFLPARTAFLPARTALLPTHTAFLPARTAFLPAGTVNGPARTGIRRSARMSRRFSNWLS